jgi:hypothetical protein
MEERIKFHVGLDVHKDSISVAVAEPGRAPGRLVGKVAHDVSKLLKMLAKIGTAEQLHIVYEAGPTGFGLQRALAAKGYFARSSRRRRFRVARASGSKPTDATAFNWPNLPVPVS